MNVKTEKRTIYCWQERAWILALSFYFLLLLLRFNYNVIEAFEYPILTPAGITFLDPSVLAYGGVALLIVLQLIALYAAVKISLWLMRPINGPLRVQLQLRSILTITIVAAVLLYLNLRPAANSNEYAQIGFPEGHYFVKSILSRATLKWSGNAFFALTLLMLCAFACERLAWPLPQRSQRVQTPETMMDARDNTVPESGERWRNTIPLLLLFLGMQGIAMIAGDVESHLQFYRRKPRLSAAWLVSYGRIVFEYAWVLCGFFAGLAWFYFYWACQTRARLRLIRRCMLVALFVLLSLVALAIVDTCFTHIQFALRKK